MVSALLTSSVPAHLASSCGVSSISRFCVITMSSAFGPQNMSQGSMDKCIERGLSQSGFLPGGLNVKRRAKGIYDALLAERGLNLTPSR